LTILKSHELIPIYNDIHHKAQHPHP